MLRMMSPVGVDPARHQDAIALIKEGGLVDLHVDTLIPYRFFCYNIFRRHKGGPLFGHLDLPRIQEAGLSAAMWSITTNPLRLRRRRWAAFLRNWQVFCGLIERSDEKMRFVRNVHEYNAAFQDRVHAVFLSIQGGNALELAPEGLDSLPVRPKPDLLTRMTLVHMTDSVYGASSNPWMSWRKEKGLTEQGREMIRQLNSRKIFTDLAHIHPQGFWEALEVHDRSLPVIVTHTGVQGINDSWRNLSDEQIKAVADTGGVIGVIFHLPFLKRETGGKDPGLILEHLEHIIKIAGEDVAAIGSDYDGLIVPPKELYSGAHYPLLVEKMLRRGWSSERIKKILSGNFLRAFARLRP